MKVIYSGLESSGKSLRLAMLATELVYRNAKWNEKTGNKRPIVSNLRFSQDFYQYATEEMGVPIIYWENLDDIIKMSNCDILIDEVANYFDSRMWQDLSLDCRRWLTQGAKSGIEIYGTAQDFAQVDKAFRRLVNHLYHIRKIVGSRRPSATKPPVKTIWGVCLMTELDPQRYDEEKSKFAPISVFDFQLFYIEKQYCEVFDTTQKIERSRATPLRHIERECEEPNCTFHKTIHV